jgi:3-hydroxyacyl-CoA dehydrogenase
MPASTVSRDAINDYGPSHERSSPDHRASSLDTVWHITDYWARQTGDPQLRANAEFIRTYLDRGRLGVKSGQGFYSYPDPGYEAPGFVESHRGRDSEDG